MCPAQFREGKLGPAIGSRAPGQAARYLDAASSPRTLIGLQYETYFFRSLYLPGFDPGSGETAEAVPFWENTIPMTSTSLRSMRSNLSTWELTGY
jgi:hypothetical protein